MSPELLPLLKKHVSFHRAGIEELARRLPPEAELDEWLSAAVQRYDEHAYVLLSLAALHAGRTLNGKHLERGLLMLGNDEHYGPRFAWRSQGDVPAHVLWAINNTYITPKSQSALLVLLVIWCQERKKALPPQVFSLTRQLFRSDFDLKQTAGHLICIAALTQEPGLVTVAKGKLEGAKVPDFSKWGDIAAQTRTELLERWNGSIMKAIPELPPAAPRVRAAGSTMRRAVERVGRNEPCPCGSGKKYKHCCIAKDEERLHHSSHVAGKTVEEVLAAPEPHLTFDMLNHLRPHQVAQLDPLKLNPAIMKEYLFRLPLLCLFDRFIEIAPTLPWDENMKFAWAGAMMFACRDGRREVLKRLAALRTEEQIQAGGGLSFAACLMLADEQPAEQVKLLDKLAENVLANEEVDEARLVQGLTECALDMLYSNHRRLGILIARGFIPLLPPAPAARVLNLILATRDQLNLSPDDPFSDVVDKMLLKERAMDESADAAAFRKARRNLEKKAEEVRELKETLAKVQRDLELREKKEKRTVAESAPAPSTEEKKEMAELRARLDGIKSALKQTHLERNEFRRDLEQAHVELEQLRAAQPKSNEAEPPDQEESLLLPPEPASNQPVRMLEFPKKFEETLQSVPRHIARSTMVTLGQIAGGEPAGFVGARRLNVCEDITRQRIGGDYRLLMRLLPDRVQVVTLINRRDLDRTIKSLV